MTAMNAQTQLQFFHRICDSTGQLRPSGNFIMHCCPISAGVAVPRFQKLIGTGQSQTRYVHMRIRNSPYPVACLREIGFSNSAGLAVPAGLQYGASICCGVFDARKLGRQRRKRGEGMMIGCNGERTPPTAETNFLVKLAWYGSEAVGNVVSKFRPNSPKDDAESQAEEKFEGPISRTDAADAIRRDYDRSYFVTGNMATGIYEDDCEFADPFVSFKGLQRFKTNVGNLGSFMENSSLTLTDWQEYEDRVYAKWRFNCVLALPWRPILAATGSTEYIFKAETGKICKHVEKWDISPVDGLKQLVKPNPRLNKGK